MTSVFINNGKGALWTQDADTLSYKMIFLNSTYTPDVDNDIYLSDISTERASGSSDQSLTNVSFTVNDTNNYAVFDADDISLTGQTFDACDKVGIYIDTGNEATSEVIVIIDILEVEPVGGNVTITWNADGIFAY